MIPKQDDVLKADATLDAQRVGYGRGSYRGWGDKESIPEGSLLQFVRAQNNQAYVRVIYPKSPKIRKMLKIIHPDTWTRQVFAVDPYKVSFHCKKDDYNETMLLGQ